MKTIKKFFVLSSIVLWFSMGSCIQYIDMHDDPMAYDVSLLLETYNVESIKGTTCMPEDIFPSNEGFWITNLDEGANYKVAYDQALVDSGTVLEDRVRNGKQELLVPITEKILTIIPKEISIYLWTEGEEKNNTETEISLVKKD